MDRGPSRPGAPGAGGGRRPALAARQLAREGLAPLPQHLAPGTAPAPAWRAAARADALELAGRRGPRRRRWCGRGGVRGLRGDGLGRRLLDGGEDRRDVLLGLVEDGRGGPVLERLVQVLVVLGPLLPVREHVVRERDPREEGLDLVLVRSEVLAEVLVRVEVGGDGVVRALDLLLVGVAADPEQLVVGQLVEAVVEVEDAPATLRLELDGLVELPGVVRGLRVGALRRRRAWGGGGGGGASVEGSGAARRSRSRRAAPRRSRTSAASSGAMPVTKARSSSFSIPSTRDRRYASAGERGSGTGRSALTGAWGRGA